MFFNTPKPKEAPAAPATADAVVFDATSADFETLVLRASMKKPVIAYFTAPWCGPCKQLGPMLEAEVRAANGEVLLAKINMDENQELATALRIQSIPTIYAFFAGRPLDAFQGALPAPQVKEFVEKLVQVAKQAKPGAIDVPESLKVAAQALADGDARTAQSIYSHILSQDEKNAKAYVGLVRSFIAAGQIKEAEQLVDNAPDEIAKDSSFSEARTALELAKIKPQGSTSKLSAAIAKDPDDHQARYDLALAQFTSGQREEGIESLLEILRRNRGWNEEEARKQLLKFFEAMGGADPLTIQSRRKLSTILFS